MKLNYKIFLLALIAYSCNDPKELLQQENSNLKSENDSLKTLLDKFHLMPYFTNLSFETTVNDTFRTKAILIQKDGLTIDSVRVKGFTTSESQDFVELVKSDHGTYIEFSSKEPGEFEVKAYSQVPIFDNKVVPITFPVFVKKKTEHNKK